MVNCILCFTEASDSQLISVKERINDSKTLSQAIRENIECYFVSLKKCK